MESMEKKLTRPFFVIFTGITFLILPLLNLLQAYLIHNVKFPFFRLTTILYYFPPYVSLILLVIAPIIGIGILKVKKWAYYGFFIYCSFLIINNIFQIIKSPRIFEISSFVYSTLTTLGIAYFLNRDIRSPYIQDEERGWRIGKRSTIDFNLELNFNNEILTLKGIELSRAGCLVELPNNLYFDIGSSYTFQLLLKNERFSVQGIMLRKIGEKQLGIQFSKLLPKKFFKSIS